jgi:hypothetical protein
MAKRLVRPKRLVRLLRRTPIIGRRFIRAELQRRHLSAFGRLPRIDAPSGFNEWILHRMLHDRDPRLRTVCDKLAVRDFVRQHAGPEFVVPLLGSWQDPASIPWDSLPRRFVLKPNHSSGRFAIVRTDADRNPAALSAKAARWLRDDFFDANLEWGYLGMPRRLLAEPLLTGPAGEPLAEPHVYTFHGKAAYIGVLADSKLTGKRSENWFDAAGRPLSISTNEYPVGEFALSAHDAKVVVALAERVAAGFDHMRVDIWLTDEGPKIGELTPYNCAGRMRWKPPEWDEKFGRLWQAGPPKS